VPQQPVTLDGVDCGYGSNDDNDSADTASAVTILKHVRHTVTAGSRIGVLGANGQGKSTLIKTIAGTLRQVNGVLRYGKDIAIGYFAQHELDVLRPDETPLQHFVRLARDLAREGAPQAREQELRNWLGRFQFSGDMVMQPVGSFSGGEKARLVLAMIVWQRPNLLLLDEPTNHLDMQTREALTLALAQYEGAMLLVSHDRALLRAVCDNFWLVADGTVADFDGDLEDYQRWVLDRKRNGTRTRDDASSTTASEGADSSEGASRKSKEDKRREAEERQRQAAARKPLQNSINKVEKQMAELEPQLKTVEAELADSATYAALSADELTAKLKLAGDLRVQLEALESHWLDAQAQLEELP
jgi:ATP-binding cassette, subfamily F, member 3